MSRYRKATVAALGVALQGLALAATAVDSGLLPEAWRPWGGVIIALATAAGVYAVPNRSAVVDDGEPRDAA